jgi:hypothetical protein
MPATGDTGDEGTRVDREPPAFPSVNNESRSWAAPGSSESASLFSSADDRDAPSADMVVVPTHRVGGPTRMSRWRWAVAALSTLVVLSIVGGVLLLAAPHAGTPSVLSHYVPADVAGYFEVDTSMPGDQKANTAAFMSHFPGFADQAAFQQKIDESLEQLFKSMNSGLDWKNDIQPSYGGQIAIFGSNFAPSYSTDFMMTGEPVTPDIVAAITIKDRTRVHDLIAQKLADSHATYETQQYQGADEWTVGASGDAKSAIALTDDALLASLSVDLIHRSLDVHTGQTGALAADQYFITQLGQFHADRLATMYYDGAKAAQTPLTSNPLMPAACTQLFESSTKVKYAGEVRAESDRVGFTIRSQPATGGDLPPLPQNRHTTLAESMPANTVAYSETRSFGAGARYLIKQYLACMQSGSESGPLPFGLGDPSQLFGQILGTKPEDFLDFVDDAGFGLSYSDGKFGGGVVATVDDTAVATQRVTQLIGLLRLGGSGLGSSGAGMSIDEIDHNGVKINVIKLQTPGSVPASNMQLQIGVANGKLYLGVDDFVTAALDRAAADSLAANDAYASAVGSADNAGVVYVDIAALRAFAEQTSTSDSDYETNVKPFVVPLNTLAVISHVDNGTVVANAFLLVE